MKEIHALELLPKETRILFNEATAKQLFQNKVKIMNLLKLHRNTVDSWICREYKPSIEQLEKLGIDIKANWDNVISINLEGGRKKFLIPECLPIDKLSWLLGILDGDGIVERNHRIGIVNQDTKLVKNFIETCKEIFGIDKEDFSTEVIWNNKHNIGKEISVKRIKTRTFYNSQYKSNKPIVRVVVNSRILYSVMENFREFMKAEIENGNAKKFALYVRGLMDSDGSFARNNIYLTQKVNSENKVKMLNVKKILDALEILHGNIKGPNSKNMLCIYLSGNRENLMKYNDFIGFNSKHKIEKLSTLLS